MLIYSIMNLPLFFLVLLQLIFCSSAGFFAPGEIGLAGKGNLGKSSFETVGSVQGAEDRIPALTHTTSPLVHDPLYHERTMNNNQPSSLNIPNDPKTFGENLATKYFGKDFIKGFRWGYKEKKRIHSVAEKCEKVMDALELASCPKPTSPSPSPLPDSEIVNCIVEVTSFDGLDETCTKTYESSQVPPEATCNLDEPSTLDASNCVKIKP